MNITEIYWKNWLKEGDQYLNAATPKKEKSKFGTEIRYNLLSMSLEKYIMAILDFHKTLPDNHTYTDLFNALDQVAPIESNLRDRIMKYENIQSICSVDKFHIAAPSEEDLLELREAITELKVLAHEACAGQL